jgi:hypothetical protein
MSQIAAFICNGQQNDKHSGVEASAGFALNFRLPVGPLRLKPRFRLYNIILTITIAAFIEPLTPLLRGGR